MSSHFSNEQLELAKWLVSNAKVEKHDGYLPQVNVPNSVGGPGMHAPYYELAASIASSLTPNHYVLYLAEYRAFFFQPRPWTFPVFKG